VNEQAKILLIEFQDGRPFHVCTRDEEAGGPYHWDFEYCRRDDRIYYNMCGVGNEIYVEGITNPIWLDRGIKLDVQNRLKRLPRRYALKTLFDDCQDSDCEYCGVCKDWLPTDCLCDHIWWCEECGWWSSPDERCEHPH
jgi:hypothetical protein